MAVGKGTPEGKDSLLRTPVRSSGAAGEPGSQAGMAVDC